VLIVPTEDIRAGMRLAAPLLHPQNPQHELLRRGYTLELSVLPKLRDLGVPFVYVDFPGLDDLDKHLAPRLSPERQRVYEQVKKAVTAAQGKCRPAVSYDDYYASTRDLINTLLTQGQHPIYMDAMAGLGGDEVAHATSVAHLALMLGLRLETYLIAERKRLAPKHARDVVNLGVAGMLHDVGKLKLPEPLRGCNGVDAPPDNDARRSEWESHARLGYELIRGGVESSAASAVLHHHQHYDGTGFPAKPQEDDEPGAAACQEGKTIHVFSRILMAADLYERLASPRGARNKRSNLEVYFDLRTRYASWVDPVVLKTLQTIAPPFLPGTTVVLSDRTQGVIVDVKLNEPYAPIVKRLRGDGTGLIDPAIDPAAPGSPTVETAAGVAVRPLLPENAATRAA
jgi:hypothetical protein